MAKYRHFAFVLGIAAIILFGWLTAKFINKKAFPIHSGPLTHPNPSVTQRTSPVAYETNTKTNLSEAFSLVPTLTSKLHGWVIIDDGKDTNFLRLLALNPHHYEKMAEENSSVIRRQLVYRNIPTQSIFQKAKLTGEPITELVLPGLDGQEFLIEPIKVELAHDASKGELTARIKGRPNSVVSLAFINNREAFVIIDYDWGLYLVGDPRHPGELIVKQVDPTTHGRPDLLWPQDFIKRENQKISPQE